MLTCHMNMFNSLWSTEKHPCKLQACLKNLQPAIWLQRTWRFGDPQTCGFEPSTFGLQDWHVNNHTIASDEWLIDKFDCSWIKLIYFVGLLLCRLINRVVLTVVFLKCLIWLSRTPPVTRKNENRYDRESFLLCIIYFASDTFLQFTIKNKNM